LAEWVVLHLGSTIGSDAGCIRVIMTQLVKMNRGHGRFGESGVVLEHNPPKFRLYESLVLTVKRLVAGVKHHMWLMKSQRI